MTAIPNPPANAATTGNHDLPAITAKAIRLAADDYHSGRLRLSYSSDLGCYDDGATIRDLRELRRRHDDNEQTTPLALNITAACYRHLPDITGDYLLTNCTTAVRRTAAIKLAETGRHLQSDDQPDVDRYVRLLLRAEPDQSAESIAADLLNQAAHNLLDMSYQPAPDADADDIDLLTRADPDPATQSPTKQTARATRRKQPASVPEDIALLLLQAENGGAVAPLVYLASPYTHPNPQVMDLRLKAHSCAAAHLIEQGVNVHPPLLATAPLAQQGIKHPQGWYAYDAAFLRACRGGVIVLALPGWQQSFGVRAEVLAALAMQYPVRTIQPDDAGVPDHIQRALQEAA